MPLQFHRDFAEVHLEIEQAQRHRWVLAPNFQLYAIVHSRNKFFHRYEVKKLPVVAGYFLHSAI